VLGAAAPEGSFRPGYTGSDKEIKFNKNDLDYSLLSNMQPASSTPALSDAENYFEKPWIDHQRAWATRYQHPAQNMPNYGREMSTQVGEGALMLHLDYTNQEKETLLVRFVQLGIDFFEITENGGGWDNNGGHASGRKWPVLFAGLMLDDESMKNIGQKSGDYLYENGYGPGNAAPDYIHFGEDDQTFHVAQLDVDLITRGIVTETTLDGLGINTTQAISDLITCDYLGQTGEIQDIYNQIHLHAPDPKLACMDTLGYSYVEQQDIYSAMRTTQAWP